MKRYKAIIAGLYDWECVVEIADGPETAEAVRQMVDFWSGAEERLDRFSGDYNRALVSQIACCLIVLSIKMDASSAIEALGEREGYCPLDGSRGIRVVSTDEWEFDEPEVKEVAA